MDMPLLKLVEILIVVVAGVAFYVWQMRQLRIDRARTAAQNAAAQQAQGDAAGGMDTPGERSAGDRR